MVRCLSLCCRMRDPQADACVHVAEAFDDLDGAFLALDPICFS